MDVNRDRNSEQLQYSLFEAIRQGDEEAFMRYYLGFFGSIVRFLTQLIGSEEEAKEIAQDVFAFLWEKREMIEPEKALDNLIYSKARGLAYNLLRHRTHEKRYADERTFSATNLDFSADEDIIRQQTAEVIEDIIAHMPEKQGRVYRAHRIENRPLKEVAEEMGITYESARTYMKRATVFVNDKKSQFFTHFLALLLLRMMQ
jgi:RNA polymerase sigma-70 factor (ECF subfamily)